jgi:hypothetical protein
MRRPHLKIPAFAPEKAVIACGDMVQKNATAFIRKAFARLRR